MSARNTFAATRRSHAIMKRLRRGEGVTIREVSDEFGIQYPQARADLKLLEELYDLNTYRDGRIKVWELPGARDNTRHVGIAAALELGGVALDVFRDTPYGERIDELIAKCRRSVGEEAREGLERLSKALVLRRTWLPVHQQRMLSVLEEFLDAIRLCRGIEMTYERSDGEVNDYVVIPRRLIWYQGRLWLQATESWQQKLFDVAAVLEAEQWSSDELVDYFVDQEELDEDDEEQLEQVRNSIQQRVGEAFEYASRAEEDAFFEDAFGIYAENYETSDVTLMVRGSWEQYLRRYRVHPSQENTETDDGLEVTFHIRLCPEFKSFLLGMIPDVEIKVPAALREELQQRADDWN